MQLDMILEIPEFEHLGRRKDPLVTCSSPRILCLVVLIELMSLVLHTCFAMLLKMPTINSK